LLQPQDDACDVSEGVWRGVLGVNLANEADQAVLDYALIRLRAKLGYTNIAFHLLPEMFTLSELQRAYESILLHPVDKRNFRRRILASGILSQTDEKRRDGSHRPAALYRFASREDHTTYLTPPQPGTSASPRQESSR
jgi:8-oxo-dGTP diphosphatase